MGYRMKSVSERLGIPKNTLIAWEQRYGFPKPARLPNGYRLYSESDVAALEMLKRLLDSGLRISEALMRVQKGEAPNGMSDSTSGRAMRHDTGSGITAGRPTDGVSGGTVGSKVPSGIPSEVPNGISSGIDRASGDVSLQEGGALTDRDAGHLWAGAPEDAQRVLEPVWRRVLERLMSFDRPGADLVLLPYAGQPFASRLEALYFPLLRALGDGWERGRISVAQEHFASAFCRDHMALMLLQLSGHRSKRGGAVCAGFPGDRHELGALGVAIQLAASGQRTVYLGADVPLEELCRCALDQGADSVWVSIIGIRSASEVLTFTREVRRALPASTRVVIGGRGLPEGMPERLEGVTFARRFQEVRL